MGWSLLAVIGAAAAAFGATLASTNRGSDWRWIRYPVVLAVLIFGLFATTTAPWPDGLGLESCETVANPALESDAAARPQLLETCSDLGVDAAPILLSVALALFLLAPEFSEFGVPGLLQLKRRVAEQEVEIAEVRTQVTDVAVSSRSSAQLIAPTTINITTALERDRAGRPLRLNEKAALIVAQRLEVALLDDLARDLRRMSPSEPQVSCAIYLFHPRARILRQLGSTPGDVTEFVPGNGAAGQAFSQQEPIVVTGDAVSNSDYGLTPEQQRHFSGHNIAAAAPLRANPRSSDTIGVLTAMSTPVLPDAEAAREELRSTWAATLETSASLVVAYLEVFGLAASSR